MKESTTKNKISGRIQIDPERCKGCGYCIAECPTGSIVLDEQFNSSGYFAATFAHPEACTGCGICAHVCPDIAIEVWREE